MLQAAALLTDHILPHQPIRQYVLGLPFPLIFLLAAKPELINLVLKTITHSIEKAIIKKAGFTQKTAQTGAVTFIQRFGSDLNLNIHFHMLFLDGAYLANNTGNPPRFIRVKAMTARELHSLQGTITEKLITQLEKNGFLALDAEQPYLNLEDDSDNAMQQLKGFAITYRIATGPLQGQKTLTIKSLPAMSDDDYSQAVKVNGFSLHAGEVCQANERKNLERLCRYTARSALSKARLSRNLQGRVLYKLKRLITTVRLILFSRR